LNIIKGCHIYDAIAKAKMVNSKSGEVVRTVLEAARKNGLSQGGSEERFFIKTAIVGKKLRGKKIDIKGRGKHGMITGNQSSVSITLEEKQPADFYRMILLGKTPPGLAWMMRRMLYQNQMNFYAVKQMSHMTTSKGRRYRRLQFQRLVLRV
jgi:hypothetical protein